ncbi:hypothetical protein [Stackebrandtia soli]|uniref:hypothetical protein n=1 Tax=Stackebrandtia soli TaxID=1892856 RepID=UPI0039E9E035
MTSRSPESTEPMPGSIRLTRILVWVQATGTLAWSMLEVGTIVRIQGLSEAALKDEFNLASHADVPYGAAWTQAIVLAVFGLVLGIAAVKFPGRSRRVRAISLAAEAPLILLGVLNIPALNCVLALGVAGFIAFVMLLRPDSRDWFDE